MAYFLWIRCILLGAVVGVWNLLLLLLMMMMIMMMMLMQGSVEFIESNEFRIEVNATSSSIDNLARFHCNFTDFHGSLLLQMVREQQQSAAAVASTALFHDLPP